MERKWWHKAVGYQIYPRTFFDSNHDGIGDIQGIIDKFDYIKNLGVNLLWICPFYQSPMDDNGYDVSNFIDVDPQLGTFEQFKQLITLAHQSDIKIVLDLVLNQSSDEHPWFIESRKNRSNSKRDWYIWRDGKIDQNGQINPPNNWASFFGGSCWEYDKLTQQYYMKIFSNKMPDLNWENTDLRQAMMNVARFWLDNGVDGFRIDAIAHLAKDLSFSDSKLPLNFEGYAPEWSKFSHRPRLFEYLTELHEQVFNHYDCVTIGEVGGSATIKDAILYAGYQQKGINMVFNFDHCWCRPISIELDNHDVHYDVDVIKLKKTISKWIDDSKDQVWIPHYWLNHDHPRVISQYGDPLHYHTESGKMLGMILCTLPGTPFIYNGEEIGMTNVDYNSLYDFQDVWAKNFIPSAKKTYDEEKILQYLRRSSRDNARTPMQWNSQKYAGFSQSLPHQKVVGNYPIINVENQQSDPNSILSMYKSLIRLRLDSQYSDCLIYGDYTLMFPNHPSLFMFKRTLKSETIMTIANFSDQQCSLEFDFIDYDLLLNNYDFLVPKVLAPFQALILTRKEIL